MTPHRPHQPLARLGDLNVSRRQVLAGGLMLASLPLFAGCFGGGGSDAVYDQPSGDIPKQYHDRLRVVLWSSFTAHNGEIMQKNIDAFNESQNEIFCEVQVFEGYDQLESKIAASLQSRQVPDISVMSDVFWNRFYLNDVIEPLTGYFDSSFGTDSFHDVFLEEGTVKNDVWWVPFARSTPLFYFNRDAFAAVGLPDRAPETYDEYREWGKEFLGYKNNGNDVRIRAFKGSDDWYFSGAAWAFGGGFSNGLETTFTSEGTIAALEYERGFIHDDKVGYFGTDISGDFVAGVTATILESTGALTSITEAAPFEVGCGFMPKQQTTGVPTGGSGLAIFRNASEERKQAAWEVLKFLSSGDAAVDWTLGTGYMPVTKSAMESEKVKAKASEVPNFQVAIDQLDIAQGPDTVRRYVPETIREAQQALQAVYSSGDDAEQTLATLEKNLEPAIDKIRAKYEAKVGN
ncbi:extracellular solute-binding protein [Microbacterium sp. YY-01]|uniref:ABC transporter substrate-binding protein n=1 Tax=Microbacterium sp. YY-01 TaxID=3421634 RepID=UPI003D171260